MEIAKIELEAVEQIVRNGKEQQVLELNDLQLSLVGGGSGMVVIG